MKRYHRVKIVLGITLTGLILAIPAPAHVSAAVQVKNEAGNGDLGFTDGSANEASFSFPYGLSMDKDGGIVIADSYSNTIRLYKNDQVTTIAGNVNNTDANGLPAAGYKDGEVMKAQFNHPRGVAVDSKGNIFVSDSDNNCIRIITGGKVYTLAGGATAGYTDAKGKLAAFDLPSGIAIDQNDNLYVADTLNHLIRTISPRGEVTTLAGAASEDGGYLDGAADNARFNEPSDVAVDNEGTVYVLDSGNQMVRKIKDGMVTTIAGINSDRLSGTSYAAGGYQNGSATQARFNFPMGIDVAEDGTIFIADTWNHRVRVIAADGSVGTLAGNGIPGLVDGYSDQAEFNGPTDVLYRDGTLYISDQWNNCIRSVNVQLGKLETLVDRASIKETYQFDEVSDEIQLWYEGSRISLTKAKAYKEGAKIYVPLRPVATVWGAKVKWIMDHKRVLVKKKGFYKSFIPGEDVVTDKQGNVYIDAELLETLTGLRIEWFPENNALVIEER